MAVGSTTVMRMPSAPTLSEDTAAPANPAMWGTGPSAEVGLLPWGYAVSYHPTWALGTHVQNAFNTLAWPGFLLLVDQLARALGIRGEETCFECTFQVE